MIEALNWSALALTVIVALRVGWHMYRMKSDRYYKFRVNQSLQDRESEKRPAQLRRMAATTNNPHLRQLAEKLVGKAGDLQQGGCI